MSYEQFAITMLSFKNVLSVNLNGNRVGIRYVNGSGYFPVNRHDKMNEAINNCERWSHLELNTSGLINTNKR